jgi:predicted HTH transcriptional regulator
MADNGSPKLVFEPVNDTDDYTMVTAYINEEFARVKAEEDGRRVEDDLKALGKSEKKVTENVTENVTEVVTELFSDVSKKYLKNYKGKQKATAEKILNAITSNNHVTIAEMAEFASVSDRTIKRYLKDMQEFGAVERKGSDADGEWLLH